MTPSGFFQKTLPVATTGAVTWTSRFSSCYQMSDRLAMWVQFRTDFGDECPRQQRQPDFRVKRGLLTAAIAGGLLVAPACGSAQEQLIVTITAGDDLGGGIVKTFEDGGLLSIAWTWE